MKLGKMNVERTVRQCRKMRRPLPSILVDMPELNPGLEMYWTAFHELDSCRPFGFGVGPIPITSVFQYARELSFSPRQTDNLIHHVRAMDKAYIDYTQDKEKSKAPKNSKVRKGFGSRSVERF